jgi:hypothetical protein
MMSDVPDARDEFFSILGIEGDAPVIPQGGAVEI